MYKRILIATDGSPSRRAITAGIALAAALHAEVVGFHARPTNPTSYPIAVPKEVAGFVEQKTISAAEKCLAAIQSKATKAGVLYRGISLPSDSPADAILNVARRENCDLIVVASHGRKGISRVILGSETAKVLAHSTKMVLVVP